MLGVRVTVPIACFRKGLAREYLETESLPPPATPVHQVPHGD